ncbi:hypothetical protein K7X08_021300 [Anisodus acutangulus]|uniref:Uncharacterized protein n=1 Tax=Anisodus acutangulus TaxID=402998 RepID=A0A9Q1M1W8_9SOLA|nr:hypothetical protein K7X08_021300 [Anisodus acutangulus]
MQTRAVVVEKRIEKSVVPVNTEVQQQMNTTSVNTEVQVGTYGTVIGQVAANVVTPVMGTLKPLPPTSIMVTPMHNSVIVAAPVPAQRKLEMQGQLCQPPPPKKGVERQPEVPKKDNGKQVVVTKKGMINRGDSKKRS